MPKITNKIPAILLLDNLSPRKITAEITVHSVLEAKIIEASDASANLKAL